MRRAAGVTAALMVLAVGCADDPAPEWVAFEERIAAPTEATGGDPDAPAGSTEFGIPFPAGGYLASGDHASVGRTVELAYATDRFDELVGFYDDYIDGVDEPQVTRARPAPETFVWQAFRDDGRRSTITLTAFAEITVDGSATTATRLTLDDG